ncbi:hypothetical protein [Actinomadura rubteroloni]|nr:hypothetical protein [Actinomadura rubteroloni]
MNLVFVPAALLFLAFVLYAGLAVPLTDVLEPLLDRWRARKSVERRAADPPFSARAAGDTPNPLTGPAVPGRSAAAARSSGPSGHAPP